MSTDNVTVTLEIGEKNMAVIDLPENVTGLILKAGSEAFQQGMTDINTNASHIHNVTRGSIFRKFDEIGSLEGRANSGVNATPMASPVVQEKTD